MDKWLEILVYSIILAILVNIISFFIFELFGSNLKRKITRLKRKIVKFIKNENYPVTIILKTVGLNKYKLTQSTLSKGLEELWKTKEVTFSNSKGAVIFETEKGASNIKCEFLPDYEIKDEEKLKISELQINIKSKISYKGFEKQFLDVYSLTEEIKEILSTKWKLNISKISSLDLPHNIIFSDIKKTEIKNLKININNHEVNIWGNKVDIYGDIGSKLIKVIKEIILLYY